MARTQAKILCSIWADRDWCALSGGAQRLYLVILSQPRLNLAGHIDVMPERWARLCSDWAVDDVYRALNELVETEFVAVDGDELVVRTFTQHDLGHGAVNGNLVKGMWSSWKAIVSPLLRSVVVDNLPQKLWDMPGVTPPDDALKQRSEPRFEPRSRPQFEPEDPQPEPRFEPQLEPRFPQSGPKPALTSENNHGSDCGSNHSPNHLFPVPCSLLPTTSSSLRTTAVDPDPAPPPDDKQQPRPDRDLDQLTNLAVKLYAEARTAATPGVDDPRAYAARCGATAATDGTREQLRRLITAGATPETAATQAAAAVASPWDPLGATPMPVPPTPEELERVRADAARREAETQQMLDEMRDFEYDPEAARTGMAMVRAALTNRAPE